VHRLVNATAACCCTAGAPPGASSSTSAATPPHPLTYSLFRLLSRHRRASACAASACVAAEPPGARRLTSAAARARAPAFAIMAARLHLQRTGRAPIRRSGARSACMRHVGHGQTVCKRPACSMQRRKSWKGHGCLNGRAWPPPGWYTAVWLCIQSRLHPCLYAAAWLAISQTRLHASRCHTAPLTPSQVKDREAQLSAVDSVTCGPHPTWRSRAGWQA